MAHTGKKKSRKHQEELPETPSPSITEDTRETRSWNSSLVLFAAGLIMLSAAVLLTGQNNPFFYKLNTAEISASSIVYDLPHPNPLLFDYLLVFTKLFLKEHLFSIMVFFLPSWFLITCGLGGILPDKNASDWLFQPINSRFFLAGLFFVSLILVMLGHFFILGHLPPAGDEFCYVFQGDLLAQGKLYAGSPEQADFFQSWSIVNDGRWYGKVTIGWPLLLAIGRFLQVDFLIAPICTAFSVVLLYLTGREIFGHHGGLIAAFLGMVTPFFMIAGGTYFPHQATVLFLLLYLYALIKMKQTSSWKYVTAAGFALFMMVLTRPGDGFIIFLGFIPLTFWLLKKSSSQKTFLWQLMAVFAFFAAAAAVLLLVNKVQTGDFLLFGYQKYNPEDAWGFRVMDHTFMKGLYHTLYYLMRTPYWSAPLLGPLILLGFFKGNALCRLILAPVAALILFYLGFYTTAAFEIGSRYYLPAYMLSIFPATGGILALESIWEKKKWSGQHLFFPVYAGAALIFIFLGVFPRMLPAIEAPWQELRKNAALIANPPGVAGPSVLFLKNPTDKANFFLIRNFYPLDKQNHIMALYLDPEENEKLMKKYSGRKHYLVNYFPERKVFGFTPRINNERTYDNYMMAAMNYAQFDLQKSINMLYKAHGQKPDDPEPLLKIISMHYERKEYAESARVCRKLLNDAKVADRAAFELARNLIKMGNMDEAVRQLETVIQITGDKNLAAKARMRQNDYTGKYRPHE